MFVTPLSQGRRYKPCSMCRSTILLGRTEGGVANITASSYLRRIPVVNLVKVPKSRYIA